MTSSEVRSSFLRFFEQRGHAIVPSSPVVPYDDPTLLFANAGMNQFKDVFLGTGKRPYSRVADTQKCIRVSGKHNDLEEVGRDTYHHTFFEMLGNWSFGDPSEPDGVGRAGYYKKEAIAWAWELLTGVWGLPKNRLWATVYREDDETEQLWRSVTDIDHGHILRFGEKDNFWEMGETGPCGPCSEIHIDRTPGGNAPSSMVNAGLADVMEIWNLVFIQYNRDADGTLTSLPAKHVDTGMGFERMCAVLQNKESNYDTDVFTPIINAIADLTGKKYSSTAPSDPRSVWTDIDIAFRVVADHVRMLSFAMADGAVPSNTGRGSALKQVLNRAARFARILNLHEPFIYKIVDAVVASMGNAYPELVEKQSHIKRIIKAEEERFTETQKNGLDYFYRNIIGEPIRQAYIRQGKIDKSWWVDNLKTDGNTLVFLSPDISEEISANISEELKRLNISCISGEDAFRLHDTYGLHIDTIEELAKMLGIDVDGKKYEQLMEEQRKRSRSYEFVGSGGITFGGSAEVVFMPGKESIQKFASDVDESNLTFVGYDRNQNVTTIVKAAGTLVILEETPFYGEAGGQVGDQGVIIAESRQLKVLDTQRAGNLIVHILESKADVPVRSLVRARVDAQRRLATMRNHTATHLVHAALRQILGTHVHQAGSLVAPDYLRFDFAHFAKVSDAELADIESLVNEKINENIKLNHYRNIPFEEARKMGALMLFGDKYGDRVNVVEFSEFSREFCGGTHVKSAAEIGYFKFRSEGSVASGIRRIEAVTADHALELLRLQDRNAAERIDYAEQQLQQVMDLQDQPGKEAPIDALSNLRKKLETFKSSPTTPERLTPDLQEHFRRRERRGFEIESLVLEIAEIRRALEKEVSKQRLQSLSGLIETLVQHATLMNGLKVVSSRVKASTLDDLKALGDTLRAKLGSGVGLLASVIDDKVSLVCVVTDDLVSSKRLDAGKVVGVVAKIVGGRGGGKAHLATAGGKDVSKLDDAVRATESVVKSLLNN